MAMKKVAARARWMGEFETALLRLRPELAGRIDWDTATHLFFKGSTPEEAAVAVADLKEGGR